MALRVGDSLTCPFSGHVVAPDSYDAHVAHCKNLRRAQIAMTDQHARRGPALQWRESPRDHRVHGFHPARDGVAEATCTHSVPVAELGDPVELATVALDRICTPCLLNHGDELADRHGDGPDWSMQT